MKKDLIFTNELKLGEINQQLKLWPFYIYQGCPVRALIQPICAGKPSEVINLLQPLAPTKTQG